MDPRRILLGSPDALIEPTTSSWTLPWAVMCLGGGTLGCFATRASSWQKQSELTKAKSPFLSVVKLKFCLETSFPFTSIRAK